MGRSGKLHALAALAPRKNEGTHWKRGSVDPTDGLRVLERETSLALAGIPTPDCQARSLVTIPTELPKLPVINNKRKIRLRVHWMLQPGSAEHNTTTQRWTQYYNTKLNTALQHYDEHNNTTQRWTQHYNTPPPPHNTTTQRWTQH